MYITGLYLLHTRRLLELGFVLVVQTQMVQDAECRRPRVVRRYTNRTRTLVQYYVLYSVQN